MKKWIHVLLCLLMVSSLTACGSRPLENDSPVSPVESAEDTENIEPAEEAQTEPAETLSEESEETESGKTLVVYFSWSPSGNTEQMAAAIQEQTGGDILELIPLTPYPEDYDECTEVALEQRDNNERPEIGNPPASLDEYDQILIGYPIWWHTAPMIIGTFLESYDLTGMEVYPFAQSASMDTEQFDTSMEFVRECAGGANVHDGLFADPEDTEAIMNYLSENGLIAEDQISDADISGAGNETAVLSEGTQITISAGDQVFEAVLDNSETADAFAEMLPMNLSMQRVGGGREFYGGMEKPLPYDSADAKTDFENGDIAFWLGGDGLCLLYNDQVEDPEISAGIIVFGKITTDLTGFYEMADNVDITIE